MRGNPVTLIDGTVVDSWGPEWLAETGARHAEAVWIIKATDVESELVYAAGRLGGGEEQVRRLRAAVHDMVRNRIDDYAGEVLAQPHIEDRRALADRFEARWGAELGAALRERVKAIWAERRAAVSA